MSSQDLKEKYEYLHKKITEKLNNQTKSFELIQNKSAILIPIIGVVLVGIFNLVGNSNLSFEEYRLMITLEIILFFSSFCYSFTSFVLGDSESFNDPPSPDKLTKSFKKNSQKNLTWFKVEIIKSSRKAYNENEELINRKYESFKVAIILFFAGLLLLSIHIVISLFQIEYLLIPLKI